MDWFVLVGAGVVGLGLGIGLALGAVAAGRLRTMARDTDDNESH